MLGVHPALSTDKDDNNIVKAAVPQTMLQKHDSLFSITQCTIHLSEPTGTSTIISRIQHRYLYDLPLLATPQPRSTLKLQASSTASQAENDHLKELSREP